MLDDVDIAHFPDVNDVYLNDYLDSLDAQSEEEDDDDDNY